MGECVFATHQVLFLQLRVSQIISKRRSTVELSLFYQLSLVIGSSTVKVPNEWIHVHQLVVLRSSRICLFVWSLVRDKVWLDSVRFREKFQNQFKI